MNRLISSVRKPVKRQSAETYLLITLLSFAASVALTRLFLNLSGFPQLGGGGLHIAHVLWGGILLFAGAIIPLVLANRWAFDASAVLTGLGIGLFIDEVGKFITQNNDYFYPPAAPIIYAFFLIVVIIYLRLRKQPPLDPRAELYHALDALEEVLDHDLEPLERAEIIERLHTVSAQTQHPDLARLAGVLSEFLADPAIHLAPELPNYWQHIQARLQAFEQKYLNAFRLRAALVGGMSAMGIVSLITMLRYLAAQHAPDILVSNPVGVYWFLARLGLEIFVSILLLTSALFILLGRTRRGLSMSYYGLLLSLTTTNLLVFYFDQFSTIGPAAIQFTLLLGVIYYRRTYLPPQEELSERQG
ncbi:MAG: hypothetical protein JW726_06585 [Anaerolineales bacterium]|nr:hypothetical protein [Anaerolineales bacterium]